MLPIHDNVPTRSFPLVTVALIVTNFVVWLWELSGGRFEQHVIDYSYYPCSVTSSCLPGAGNLSYWESAFTSLFMHASWAHILGNMLFLWIFGNNVEDAMGHLRFLAFYLCAGLAATALQTFITLHQSGDAGASVPNLGASGAIAGVLGAYIVLLPWAKVLTIIRDLPALRSRRSSSWASGSCSRPRRATCSSTTRPPAGARRSSPTSAGWCSELLRCGPS